MENVYQLNCLFSKGVLNDLLQMEMKICSFQVNKLGLVRQPIEVREEENLQAITRHKLFGNSEFGLCWAWSRC
jgi:hypothetical protein